MISKEKSYLCSVFVIYLPEVSIDAIVSKVTTMSNFIKSIVRIIIVVAIGIAAFLLSSMILKYVNIGNDDLRFPLSYTIPMLLMISGVILYNRLGVKSPNRTMWSIRGFNPTVHIWCLILLISLSIVLAPLMQLLPESDMAIPTGMWAVVTIIVVAPIIEELLFRANIYSVMREGLHPSIAAAIAATLFGVMHGNIAVAIEAFFAGMIFSYAYIYTRSIFAPIMLHIYNNIIAYVLLQFTYQDNTIKDYIGALPWFHIIYAISLTILLLGSIHIVLTYRRANRVSESGRVI